MNCGTLAEELRVRHHSNVAAAQCLLHYPGGPHRDGRLVDDNGFRQQVGSNLRRRVLDVGQISGSVSPLGGGHAEVDELRLSDGVLGPHHEAELTGPQPLIDEVPQAGLQNRDLAPVQCVDLFLNDVGTHHGVTKVGQAGASGETHIARADNRDLASHSCFPGVVHVRMPSLAVAGRLVPGGPNQGYRGRVG